MTIDPTVGQLGEPDWHGTLVCRRGDVVEALVPRGCRKRDSRSTIRDPVAWFANARMRQTSVRRLMCAKNGQEAAGIPVAVTQLPSEQTR